MKNKMFNVFTLAFVLSSIGLLFPSQSNAMGPLGADNTNTDQPQLHTSQMHAQESETSTALDSIRKLRDNLLQLTAASPFEDSEKPVDPTLTAPNRRERVNLNDPKESLLDSVALVGTSVGEWTKYGWGSGFLISKCHLLTASHIVFHRDHKDSKNDEEMKIGKEIIVGFGQIESAPWKSENLIGKVIGFDPNVRMYNSDGSYSYTTARDWALIKLPKNADGAYPGEKRKPFCIGAKDKPLKFKEIKDAEVRSVGHPENKYLATGKLSLWQDTKCMMSATDGSSWYTSCQTKPGMSGGPVATYKSDANCWQPIGLISGSYSTTGGLTKQDEKDMGTANMLTPLDKRNMAPIYAAMEADPCD